MRFATVYEKTPTGWSAYAPDLAGLRVAGAAIEETRQLLRDAIILHVEDLRTNGQPVPKTESKADCLDLPLGA
jgi:predicted RNase H-like HicB family nuclease